MPDKRRIFNKDGILTHHRLIHKKKKYQDITAWCLIAGFGILLGLIATRKVIFVDEMSFQINILHFINHKTIVPIYINYPSLFSYLIGAPTILLFSILYAIYPHTYPHLADPYYRTFFYEFHIYHWIFLGRAIVILAACAGLFVFYRFVRRHCGRSAALFTLALAVLDPFSFYLDHAVYALPDAVVASLLFCTVAILASAVHSRSLPKLYLAAFLTGLAGSAKMNGLLPIILVLAVLIANRKAFRGNPVKLLVLTAASCYLGFAAGSPIFFINPHHYFSGFTYESSLLTGGLSVFDTCRRPLWAVQTFFHQSPVFSILILLCVLYSILRPKKWRVLLSLSISAIFLFLASLGKRSPAYFIVLYPLIFFLIADVTSSIRRRIRRPLAVSVFCAVTIILLAGTFYSRTSSHLIKEENRVTAKKWILENIPDGSFILIEWGYFPEIFIQPISEYKWRSRLARSPEMSAALIRILEHEPQYRIRVLPSLNYDIPDYDHPAYLITSTSCFDRYLTDTPRFSDLYVNDGVDVETRYTFLRDFYLNLVNEKTRFRKIRHFGEGLGPDVFIFRANPVTKDETP